MINGGKKARGAVAETGERKKINIDWIIGDVSKKEKALLDIQMLVSEIRPQLEELLERTDFKFIKQNGYPLKQNEEATKTLDYIFDTDKNSFQIESQLTEEE